MKMILFKIHGKKRCFYTVLIDRFVNIEMAFIVAKPERMSDAVRMISSMCASPNLLIWATKRKSLKKYA